MQGCAKDAASIEVEVVHIDSAASAGPEPARWRKARQEKLAETVAVALRLDPLDRRLRLQQRVLEGILPAEGILRTARESRADLLVMSTHADHPLVRTLLGTVSGAVLRQGRVPMLLIPPPVVAEAGTGQLVPGN